MKINQLKTNINENQVHVESTLAEIFAIRFISFSWFTIYMYVLLCFIIYVGFFLNKLTKVYFGSRQAV